MNSDQELVCPYWMKAYGSAKGLECYNFKEALELQKQITKLHAELDELRKALKSKACEWEQEGEYLDNPWDHESDRYAGQAYKECSNSLRALLTDKEEQ